MSGSSRWLRDFAFSAAFLFLMGTPAMAQEGKLSTEGSASGVFFHWLNFAIIVLVIGYFFWKSGPYFRGQADEISRKIAEGTRAREAAESQRREAEAKLAGIGQEIARIREEAKRGMEGETERLRALARQEAETIERAALAEIAAARRAARLELKALAARLAAERAEAMLRDEITPDAEAGLFQRFIEELQGSAN